MPERNDYTDENVNWARMEMEKYLNLIRKIPERAYFKLPPQEIDGVMMAVYHNDEHKAFFGSAGISTMGDLVKKLASICDHQPAERELVNLLFFKTK